MLLFRARASQNAGKETQRGTRPACPTLGVSESLIFFKYSIRDNPYFVNDHSAFGKASPGRKNRKEEDKSDIKNGGNCA